MAEIELSVLSKRCLSPRIEEIGELEKRITAWQYARTKKNVTIDWQFTSNDA